MAVTASQLPSGVKNPGNCDMNRCPYCRQPLDGMVAIPPMSGRQRTIYDAVTQAGNAGIRTTELVKLIDSIGPGGGVVLRVQVHELNKKLKVIRQRIKGSGGSYWLIYTGV